VNVPAANVNDFRAGYRIQIKLTRHGISSYTYYRIIRRVVRPPGLVDTRYVVTLSLLDILAPTRYLYQRGSNEVWEVKSNATPDGASVIVNRDGITVTEGAITVENATGDVIFDASGTGEVTNSAGTVTIDSSGLTVTDGALTIEDEFGKTVMRASGFTGSWTDFVRLGLYNGRFTDLTVGTLTVGRTADLPYWTLLQQTGSPVFTGLSGGGVKVSFAALSDKGTMTSDLVPVRPGAAMDVGYSYKVNRSAGTLVVIGFVLWYQSDGSASALNPSDQFDQTSYTASAATLLNDQISVLVPADATQAAIQISAEETVSHNAANYVSFYSGKLVDAPNSVPYGWNVSNTTVSPGSGTLNNYDPGDIDTTPMYSLNPSGGLTLNGLIAPSTSARLIVFANQNNANTITLAHEAAASTAANRFNCPNAANYVIPTYGTAWIWYNFVTSRWNVLNKA
jgi:hypothetical protein